MTGKPILLDYTIQELKAMLDEMGQPGFRGEQIFTWLSEGADFEQMSNLPKGLRESLCQSAIDQCVSISQAIASKIDKTTKFLFLLSDGQCIEGVLMHYHHGATLCISTQVGCRMGCQFCASTLEGCARDLSPGEMLGQIICANQYLKNNNQNIKIHNVVLMGSGEPLDNYKNTIKFLRLVREPKGLGIGLRNISLSTCGLVPEIIKLADEGLPVTLSVSLHAPNDELRRQIMPIANKYNIQETIEACKYYIQKTGRRVIIEYALIQDINNSMACARELAGRLRGMQCHVNLIPLNTIKERGLAGVSESEVRSFLSELEKLNISATRRREMGDDIQGACGQLRRSVIEAQNN